MKFKALLFFITFLFTRNLQAQHLSFRDSLDYVIQQKADKYVVLDVYFELVCELYIDGEEEEANIYADKMLAFGKENKIKSVEGLLLLAKSYQAFYDKNDFETALKYILEGMSELETVADTSFLVKCEYADALNQIGTFYEEISAYDDALSYYLQSVDYSTKNGCIEERIDVYTHLSYLYSKKFNAPKKGIQYLKDALELANQFNNTESYSMIYGNLAMEYIDYEDYENASYYLEKVMNIDKALDDSLGLSHGYLQEATLFLAQGKIEQAQRSINQALVLTESYYDWAPDVYIISGKIALAFNETINADFSFKEALRLANEGGDLSDRYNVLKELVDLSEKRNNTREALKYYSLMFAVKDSMDSQWQISNVMKEEAKAKAKEIKAEKEKVEFERKVLALKITQQRKLILFVILFLIVALVSGVIIFLQKQKLQQANLLLVQKTKALTIELKKQNQIRIQTKEAEKNKVVLKEEQRVELLKKLETDLSQKIKKALEEDKVFLDNKLTLAKFAQQLNTNTSYLSKAINTIYNKRFRTVINEYRVKEVLLFFENEESEQLTIFALAQKAGFISKSSFNTAFREYTGVTPTFYLKNVKSDKERGQDL